ncbi:hypothetical protein [Helicobacter sp. 23-1045]
MLRCTRFARAPRNDEVGRYCPSLRDFATQKSWQSIREILHFRRIAYLQRNCIDLLDLDDCFTVFAKFMDCFGESALRLAMTEILRFFASFTRSK